MISKSVLTLAAALAFAVAAQAQSKIAIIDLKKVFDGYYKTKLADGQIKERAGDFDKARKGLIDDYQKANEDYRKLMDGANDQAISSEERDKRKKNAEAKLVEIKEIENSINQFDRSSRQTLSEQQRRMRDNILREIRETITEKAKKASYNLVIDVAAESVNNTPVVLHNTGENDMTDEVLTDLNAKAPPGALSGADKADEKKDEGKEEKK
ncbi:MAG: OmpH family outer membrane protein [Verrucomicrobia bacterium]|nr:OmpH family outer membrane protein [Verrucomicrobiota bacterium]